MPCLCQGNRPSKNSLPQISVVLDYLSFTRVDFLDQVNVNILTSGNIVTQTYFSACRLLMQLPNSKCLHCHSTKKINIE